MGDSKYFTDRVNQVVGHFTGHIVFVKDTGLESCKSNVSVEVRAAANGV